MVLDAATDPMSVSPSVLSDEARIMRRPFAAYALLVVDPSRGSLRSLAVRIAVSQLVLAGALSFVAAGRLTAKLVIGSALAWAMAPLLQIAVAMGARRFLRARLPWKRTLDLHFAGNGPWLLFVLGGAGMCLFAPDVYAAFRASLTTFALPGGLLVAALWSWFLTYAFYRSAVKTSRRLAFMLVAFEVLAKTALIVGWYMFLDDIVPQLRGPSS